MTPAVVLKPDLAQAIAVALHEFATNAAKYGALSVPKGQVRVEWSRPAGGHQVLRWSQAGGPPVTPPTVKGFGIHVMEAMIRGHWEETCGSIGGLKVSRAKSLFRCDCRGPQVGPVERQTLHSRFVYDSRCKCRQVCLRTARLSEGPSTYFRAASKPARSNASSSHHH